MQKTKALIWLFPENIRRAEYKSRQTFGFLGYILRKFQGGPLKPNHVLAFCQASFLMTLSWAGFLTLAPGNFHYRRLESKSRKSRNIWSNRQIWPWSTKQSRSKANRVCWRECTVHSKHPLPTTQEKTLDTDITRWSIMKSDWLYSLQPKMEKLYTVSKNKTGSWLWLRSRAPYCQI